MEKRITLAHGNGGRLMHELITFLCTRFSNKILDERADSAEFTVPHKRLAFSTDSFVVRPLFFPGGDIGTLAVYGTVNDLAMKGARPLYFSLALIIEEGLEMAVLDRIALSIGTAAKKAGIKIVTGDIKVVERGSADKLFITTAGVGVIEYKGRVGSQAKKNDVIIINGSIAEHGLAVLNAREELGFKSNIQSDCANLNDQVNRCLKASKKITVMRDLTRGGLATTLNEIAQSSNLGIEIDEKKIPIRLAVKKLCDVLGFDPLYVANEGKFICFAPQKDVKKIKRALGPKAAIIGTVTSTHKQMVYAKTPLGSHRIIPMLEADQLPRIC